MGRLHLALLGGFEARLTSGRPLALRRAKAKALLAYLALHPGQTFARDKLVALLWPEFPEAQARHSLRQTLFTLRRNAPALDLRVDGDTVGVPPTLVAVDVDEFERSIAKATPEALSQAAGLYRGDLL